MLLLQQLGLTHPLIQVLARQHHFLSQTFRVQRWPMEAAAPIIAEMEIGFIRERQRAGIEAAKKRGAYKGRPVTLDHGRIVSLHKQGIGATEIARKIGCSRGAVFGNESDLLWGLTSCCWQKVQGKNDTRVDTPDRLRWAVR